MGMMFGVLVRGWFGVVWGAFRGKAWRGSWREGMFRRITETGEHEEPLRMVMLKVRLMGIVVLSCHCASCRFGSLV